MDEFDTLTTRLAGKIQFLYFHLMGEPMIHPDLDAMIAMSRQKGFIPILTTNGTLCERRLSTLPHKVQISLHSQEANTARSEAEREEAEARYIRQVMDFALDAAERGTIVVLRLWNQGGFDNRNEKLHELIATAVPRETWIQRYDGWKLGERLYIEYDQMFEWPDETHAECGTDEVFCYALRNQIGVLVDGTVVPCCLDHEGAIALGNLYEQELDEILASPRAKAMYEGFAHHKATESLCRRCDYAAVTKRFRRK